MKAKNIIYALGAIVVLLVLWLFINEQEKSKRKDAVIAKLIQENNQLKSAYLALLEKYLLSTNSAEPSIIKELNKLKSEIDLDYYGANSASKFGANSASDFTPNGAT
jgi:hypothetical protein